MRLTTLDKTKDLLSLIHGILEKVEMVLPVREMSDGINMSYNFIGQYIGYDAKRLPVAHKEMAPQLSFETYVTAITLHELGHVIDHEALEASLTRTVDIFTMKKNNSMRQIFQNPDLLAMLLEEDEMNIVFEKTAWDNAALLNKRYSIMDEQAFEFIRQQSLATYIVLYEEDLAAYEQLTGLPYSVPAV